MNASLSKRGGLSALIFAAALIAQPNTTAPRFEVASIKPIDPNAAMHRSGLTISTRVADSKSRPPHSKA